MLQATNSNEGHCLTQQFKGPENMETLLQDLRFGFRTFIQRPAFAIVAILTLALGIGANTAIFSVVNGVLLRSLPYKDPDRVVVLWETRSNSRTVHISNPNFVDWREQ